jgi:hypothetical protein
MSDFEQMNRVFSPSTVNVRALSKVYSNMFHLFHRITVVTAGLSVALRFRAKMMD